MLVLIVEEWMVGIPQALLVWPGCSGMQVPSIKTCQTLTPQASLVWTPCLQVLLYSTVMYQTLIPHVLLIWDTCADEVKLKRVSSYLFRIIATIIIRRLIPLLSYFINMHLIKTYQTLIPQVLLIWPRCSAMQPPSIKMYLRGVSRVKRWATCSWVLVLSTKIYVRGEIAFHISQLTLLVSFPTLAVNIKIHRMKLRKDPFVLLLVNKVIING